MQGFPKNINNRNDLDHVKVLFPEDTKKYLNNALVNRKIWLYVGDLEKEEDNILSFYKLTLRYIITFSISKLTLNNFHSFVMRL